MAPLILNLDTTRRSSSRVGRFTSRYPMNSRQVVLPDMSDLIGEGENISPAGIRFPDRPALSLVTIRNTPGLANL